jgi:RNA polymerase sigma-70 factor (ECF subfamily)
MATLTRGQVVPLHRRAPTLEALSEDGLVAAVAKGDRAARAVLFERHVDDVHRFVARLSCADAAAVDDLVQATFLTAFGAAGKFRGDATIKVWLCGVASNVARTWARGEIRRKAAMSAAAEALPTEGGSTTARLEQRETYARLLAAVSRLHHDLRAVFVLVDMEGARGQDAAAALGIPEGTLWRRLSEARAALRAALPELAGGATR